MKHYIRAVLLPAMLFAFLSFNQLCQADVTPNALFQNNMVLQRDKPIAVWGTADVGEAVTVSIAGVSATTTADSDGKWLLYLDPTPANGDPQILTFEGNNTVTLSNVLIGDVYLGSGQSNMEEKLATGSQNYELTMANANMSAIRVMKLAVVDSDVPLDDIHSNKMSDTWLELDFWYVSQFSAVLYYFGRELYDLNPDVPIGLIQATRGGKILPKWHPEMEAGHYNGMIHPLLPFTLNGVLWYQGESDGNGGGLDLMDDQAAILYSERYAEMIQLWREAFNQPNLPFFCTQLANCSFMSTSDWPLVREGLYNSMNLSNAGCTTAVDIGESNNIHPKCKEELGWRFSLWARKFLYGEDISFTGPLWESATTNGNSIEVTFAYVGSGLIAEGGTLVGFELAGADEIYETATAEIISTNTIRVSSASISDPQWVRYAWHQDPVITLYGGDKLPALTFRAQVGTTGPMPSFEASIINPPTPPIIPPDGWSGDPDGDGRNNLTELVQGTDIERIDDGRAPIIALQEGLPSLELTEALDIKGATLIVQVSTDLKTWTLLDQYPDARQYTDNGDGTQTRIISLPEEPYQYLKVQYSKYTPFFTLLEAYNQSSN